MQFAERLRDLLQSKSVEVGLNQQLLTDIHDGSNRDAREKTVSELCEHFNIDVMHSKQVASHALGLLNQLSHIRSIPLTYAPILEIAALLHDIGASVKVDRHHIYGRDLVMKHKLNGFDEAERGLLALLIALHRKNVKHKKLDKQLHKSNLPSDLEAHGLELASIMRVADGLDQSHRQTTQLENVREEDHRFVIEISGPDAKRDGGRAIQKSDLWTYTFRRPLHCVLSDKQILLPGPQWSGLAIPSQSLTRIELQPSDAILEAGRKILTFHFIRMLQHESGIRVNGEIESVHDMRVATRRMRTATKILREYYPQSALKSIRQGLKRTARTLGEVRDLDVFLSNLNTYIEAQSSWRPAAFRPLQDHWSAEHGQARQELLEYLEGREYRGFVGELAEFVSKYKKVVRASSDEVIRTQVYQVVPAIIYQRDQGLRLFDSRIEEASLDTLHALRIEIKRFRYTLEYFETVLGEAAQTVIENATMLQDQLGDLHDARFASQFILNQIDDNQPDQIHTRAMRQYAKHLDDMIDQLKISFTESWWEFRGSDTNQRIASSVAKL